MTRRTQGITHAIFPADDDDYVDGDDYDDNDDNDDEHKYSPVQFC